MNQKTKSGQRKVFRQANCKNRKFASEIMPEEEISEVGQVWVRSQVWPCLGGDGGERAARVKAQGNSAAMAITGSVCWQQIWGPVVLPNVVAEKHIVRQKELESTGGWWSAGLFTGNRMSQEWEGITVVDLGERRPEASDWPKPSSVSPNFSQPFLPDAELRS